MEDTHHFIMDCPTYSAHRETLLRGVRSAIDRSVGSLTTIDFSHMSSTGRKHILLGKRFGDPIAEDRIDRMVKRFLTKAWNLRSSLTAKINTILGTTYEVAAPAG